MWEGLFSSSHIIAVPINIKKAHCFGLMHVAKNFWMILIPIPSCKISLRNMDDCNQSLEVSKISMVESVMLKEADSTYNKLLIRSYRHDRLSPEYYSGLMSTTMLFPRGACQGHRHLHTTYDVNIDLKIGSLTLSVVDLDIPTSPNLHIYLYFEQKSIVHHDTH